jgi:hypothetical protein
LFREVGRVSDNRSQRASLPARSSGAGVTTAIVNVATRIRVAWLDLAARLRPAGPPMAGLGELRDWLTTAARAVAAPTTAALDGAPVIAAFLAAEPNALAARQDAWADLVNALAGPALPRDPVHFAHLVCEHVSALVWYPDDDGCNRCQGDLAVGYHPPSGERVDVCRLIGCAWSGGRLWNGHQRDVVPASRAQVTAWFGGADLIPLA